MYKHLFYIALILLNNTACTINSNSKVVTAEQVKVIPTTPTKHVHNTLDGVISVDVVNNNNQLHLLTGKLQHGKKSLWYQKSGDGGKTWSIAVNILNQDNLAVRMSRGNDAQITAQGNTVVVTWSKYDPKTHFHAGPMQAARSTDGGVHWQYSVAPPDWAKGPHGFIDMSADKFAMHAVWLDSRVLTKDAKATQGLRYAKSIDGGISWQSNKTLDPFSCSCCWNTIKSDSEGNAYVLYRNKQPSDMSIGVMNKQQQWHYLNHIGAFDWQFDGCPHIGGGLDFQNTLGKKRIHSIVGTGHPDHLGVYYLYSDDAGKSWSKPLPLGSESAIHADIASHDDGRVIAVWDMMTENGLEVFMAESSDQGNNWSAYKQISTPNLRASHPRIVKTEKGFFAVWTETKGQKLILKSISI